MNKSLKKKCMFLGRLHPSLNIGLPEVLMEQPKGKWCLLLGFVVFVFKLKMRKQIMLHIEGHLSLSSLLSIEQDAKDPEWVKACSLCSRSSAPERYPSRKQLHYSLL